MSRPMHVVHWAISFHWLGVFGPESTQFRAFAMGEGLEGLKQRGVRSLLAARVHAGSRRPALWLLPMPRGVALRERVKYIGREGECSRC